MVQITPDWLASQPPASTQTVPQELFNYQPESYRIGPGDMLYITVWDHPELTAPAGAQQQTSANSRLVRSDGTLFYPYAGSVKAAGMTIDELRQELTSKLTKYVPNPQVDVAVTSYGSQLITLEGAFIKSDPQQATTVPLTLSQAIGTAGIDLNHADLSDLVLTRDGRDFHLDLNTLNHAAEQRIYLKPGDRLYLAYNDNKEIYVMGEVLRPQALSFRTDDLTLTQALGRVGGLDPTTSSSKSVYVIRGVKDLAHAPATVYQLNARSPAAFALADNFHVQAGDVVWVGASAITQWGRFLSQLVPLGSLVSSAALAHGNTNGGL
ncbi:polysaccharide biosynthesis/export family protein [Dyella nitratireducens]|uniref:Capsular polysaccharide biosynthesis protein n=1 Tax=Dyella nitratireducens TaxID=1849580 RepID=A0ABQ1GFH5_9GAMM|nr:polysaccharide biosynthesis/export family protein [Dyella nitratireducens]GGA42827.1 capsular polysaccharide biosynthesis protein [Dyella nitratireducens]GLQ41951.1 capsular polysaccharide biosynthesis protein [Dyella nitratireducens]